MSGQFQPAYLNLARTGELDRRVQTATQHLASCILCPHRCGANRLQTPTTARCRTGARAVIYSFGPHFGEERPLVGEDGSGTIFFSRCNLSCVFCQNWEISHGGQGHEISADELAGIMLDLQKQGCHNINLVSPSHVVAPILAAVARAAEEGLSLPLVYNSGGYDELTALSLLDGIIDIYMPDMKFADSERARPYLGVSDYAEVNRAAVREMHRQVSNLRLGPGGIAERGLMVRHLIMPGSLAGTPQILDFLAHEISTGIYLNLMGQYRPCYRAEDFPELSVRPTRSEIKAMHKLAREMGFTHLDPG